ncbi:hypothetical protein V6L77_03500 [Pannonibacter sp. Pt2-lr]
MHQIGLVLAVISSGEFADQRFGAGKEKLENLLLEFPVTKGVRCKLRKIDRGMPPCRTKRSVLPLLAIFAIPATPLLKYTGRGETRLPQACYPNECPPVRKGEVKIPSSNRCQSASLRNKVNLWLTQINEF